MTILQQINSYNIYGIISIQKKYFKVLYSGLTYGFVIVVIETPLLRACFWQRNCHRLLACIEP